MNIIFSGDRSSKTIRFGWFLRRQLGFEFIKIMLWDGYKSKIYLQNDKKK